MEKKLLEGKRLRGTHLEELKRNLEQMSSEIRAAMKEQFETMWEKLEPRLVGQERVTAALSEALDDFMAEKPVTVNSGRDDTDKSQSLEDDPPEEGGEPEVAEPSPETVAAQGQNLAPQGRGRGQPGPGRKDHWKSRAPKQQKRVNYLVRQLKKEWKGANVPHAPQNCDCWSCRRGRGWNHRGGRGGGAGGRGFGRGTYGYGRGHERGHHHGAGPSHFAH
ncbi:hypothetical protein niasHT_033920 [Heterodera trifolii]|uniref:Uncharacterized protein n=1 Tax=Heterodera trifolii TaxID=157864 RepID=A0ABD2I1R8_9BILA